MKFKTKLAALILSSLAMSSVSIAGTDTATLNVTATAVTGCAFDTTSYNLGFGNYDGTTQLDTSVSVTFTCASNNVPYTLEADNGANYDVSNSVRRVNDGSGNYLSYGLFQDAGYSLDFGTSANGQAISGVTTLAGQSNSITVYGGMPSAQSIGAAGSYSDTVTLTLTF